MHLGKGLSEKISRMFVGIISDMEKKAINTCKDGTCRTLVAWYAKGGRSNFAAWNGSMSGVDDLLIEDLCKAMEK